MAEQALIRKSILSEADAADEVARMARDISAAHPRDPLAFVGIHTRGVVLAERVYEALTRHRSDITQGTVDISLYRDDLDNLGTIPAIKGSNIPFTVEGAHIVLFDDVLFTGRTIRAAINEIMDYGRPAKIELAVLVDRGNRELPIAADYVGRVLATGKDEYISVHFREVDGEEGVYQLLGASAT